MTDRRRQPSVHNVHKTKRPPADAGGRLAWSEPLPLVALSQFCSDTLFTDVQDDAAVINGRMRVRSPVPQRRRITARLRTDVIEHYETRQEQPASRCLVGAGTHDRA